MHGHKSLKEPKIVKDCILFVVLWEYINNARTYEYYIQYYLLTYLLTYLLNYLLHAAESFLRS